MPQRNERLLWMHAKQIDHATARTIDSANARFAGSWTECPLDCIPCVTMQGVTDHLWLFRLETVDQGVATRFVAALKQHVQQTPQQLSLPSLGVKRQSRLPTPLLRTRIGAWPKTDLGLHVVNDTYNGMLVTYTYHEAGNYHMPHLQLSGLREVVAAIEPAWAQVACPCYRSVDACCGVGCYECFQPLCSDCDGTGWQDFARWVRGGCQIDYGSGFPIAAV